MRWALLVAIAAGCSFRDGTATAVVDAPPDTPPDTPPQVWSTDATSKKACPASFAEWKNFLTAKNLPLTPPSSVWLMQEASGSLTDSLADVTLAPSGSPIYQQPVSGWTRTATATNDGSGAAFSNTSSTTLPDVGSTSMLVLMYYGNESTPGVIRSVLFGGSGVASSLGEVDIDASDHYKLTVNGSAATGTMDHGTGIVPVVLKLDRQHGEQVLDVDHEVIAPAYSPLGHSKGVLLGGASNAAPNGRWLYMAAWYGSPAEMSVSQIDALITALGW